MREVGKLARDVAGEKPGGSPEVVLSPTAATYTMLRIAAATGDYQSLEESRRAYIGRKRPSRGRAEMLEGLISEFERGRA